MMDLHEEFQKKSDRELLHAILNSPDSADGMAAREVLEYRKYLTAKHHNAWLLVLTLVLAVSSAAAVVAQMFLR